MGKDNECCIQGAAWAAIQGYVICLDEVTRMANEKGPDHSFAPGLPSIPFGINHLRYQLVSERAVGSTVVRQYHVSTMWMQAEVWVAKSRNQTHWLPIEADHQGIDYWCPPFWHCFEDTTEVRCPRCNSREANAVFLPEHTGLDPVICECGEEMIVSPTSLSTPEGPR